ncbi:hypothetical protein BH09PSE6_BH09PSE6_20580 [soil metagenome]
MLLVIPCGLFMCVQLTGRFGAPADLWPSVLLLALLLMITARRLEDRRRSRWWLMALLVPVLGPLFLLVECGFRKGRTVP